MRPAGMLVVLCGAAVSCGGAELSDDVGDSAALDGSSVTDSGRVETAVDSDAVDASVADTVADTALDAACEVGTTRCSGDCVDLVHDPKNCGACGSVCVFGTCCGGTCGGECPPGSVVCGGGDPCVCVDLATDPANCGACGKKCCTGEICSSGICVVGCGPGLTVCHDPTTGCGFCVDTTSDATNCGGCGVACAPGKICVGGSCS